MVAARHLVDGRSHPSLTKEGSSPAPEVSRVYKGQSAEEEGSFG